MSSSRLLVAACSLLLFASFAAAQVAPLTITTTSPLPSGLAGAPYFQTIVATGGLGTRLWSVQSGALPPGLTLSLGSGAITGTPTLAGAYSFTIRVADSLFVATKAFILTIVQSGTTQGPDGQVGAGYQATLVATSGTGPWTWLITSGQLPPGLTLNSVTGVISGVPTTAGTFSFVAQWTDSQGLIFPNTFAIRILAAPLTITTASPLPGAIAAVAYSQPLTATGGVSPFTWSVTQGSPPPGLALSAAGVLSGTPTLGGTFNFTVGVADSAKTSTSKAFTLTVATATLTITTASPLSNATAAVAYSQQFTVTGGVSPFTWSVTQGSLPPGLILLSAAGVLSGTPTLGGTSNFTVRVTDGSGGSTSKAFTLTVNAATLTVTTAAPIPNGTAGAAYSQTFTVSGGIAPYTWSLFGVLPPGVTFTTAGVLSGTPTAGGTFNFTVGVGDSSGGSGSKNFVLTVTVPSAPSVSVTGLTDTVSPAQQPTFDVQLSSTYALPITGTITLTFTPDAVNPSNDPAIQFSAGGRTMNFTIAAGQTRAFPTSAPAIATGTVSGRIDLTLSFSAGGQNVTPTPAPVRSVTIPRSVPKINTVQVVRVTGGFNVLVTGFSTPRQVTQAAFTFTAATGATLGTAQVPVTVDSAFTTWFAGTSSTTFGGSFLYTQPFTVQGNVNDIASVSVTLTNATGASQAVSANF